MHFADPAYDKAKATLDLITQEGGSYRYCCLLEEWHLFNEDDQLLNSSKTIEGLIPKGERQSEFMYKKGQTIVRPSRRREEGPHKPEDIGLGPEFSHGPKNTHGIPGRDYEEEK